MKVLICDPVDDAALAKMREGGLELTEKVGMSPEQLVENVAGFHGAVVRSATKFRKPAIDAATDMKVIVRGGVGLDNIDVEYAKSKGIEVRNTPAASSQSVAELALAHMFAVARFLGDANYTMRKGEWNKKKYKGIELAGKTLGVIGIGRIGQYLAKKAMALGMNVVAQDKFITQSPMKDVPLVELDELFSRSDFISLHVPFVKEDGPVIGKAELAKMKDGAVLVNCARGGTVDEDALLEALDSGKLYGAGVDVYEEEPTHNTKLLNHPKVSVTPHVGASTREAQGRVGQEVADILLSFARERSL
jgi:D-3-phosphoglycerate dehydrogenase